MQERGRFVKEYYDRQFRSEGLDPTHETKVVGKFLHDNACGEILDLGCGPSLYFWGAFMTGASVLDGVDIVPENIEFLNQPSLVTDLSQYSGLTKYIESLEASPLDLQEQFRKVRDFALGDFTRCLPFERMYDTIASTYSLGCVASRDEYEAGVATMRKHLRPGGTALFVGTTGTSRSEVIPEYCYRGVQNTRERVQSAFGKHFSKVHVQEVPLEKRENSMFPYKTLLLAIAR